MLHGCLPQGYESTPVCVSRSKGIDFSLDGYILYVIQVLSLSLQVKKRDFRCLWIQRINASARMYGFTYSALITSMQRSNIALNRKVLADLAVYEPLSFRAVLEAAKANQPLLKPNA